MIFCLPDVHLHAGSAWLSRPSSDLLHQPSKTLAGWLWPITFAFLKHTHISFMLILVPFCPQLPWAMLLYSSTFIHYGTFLHFMVVKTGIWLLFCASTCQVVIKDTILCTYMIHFVVWISQLHPLIQWLWPSHVTSHDPYIITLTYTTAVVTSPFLSLSAIQPFHFSHFSPAKLWPVTLTTTTTSMMISAHDMLGLASWPIGKVFNPEWDL